MLMKYKDLGTMLSKDEMKKVKGGDHPAWKPCRVECGNETILYVDCCETAWPLCNGSGVVTCACPASNQCNAN
jgi:natural product precursor